jgi:redox-sensitive bicupin YhaK (pirin superfamily)
MVLHWAAIGRGNKMRYPQGGPGEVKLYQDATMSMAILEPGEKLFHGVARGRGAWLQVTRGGISLNSYVPTPGDGAAIDAETELNLKTDRTTAEVLLLALAWRTKRLQMDDEPVAKNMHPH